MTMKIEVGKRYRTRDGRVATVERIDRDKEPDNAAAMSADVDGKVLFYCANGRYYSGSTNHDFDLVEELPDEQTGGPLPDLDVTELSPGAAPASEGVQAFADARSETPLDPKVDQALDSIERERGRRAIKAREALSAALRILLRDPADEDARLVARIVHDEHAT